MSRIISSAATSATGFTLPLASSSDFATTTSVGSGTSVLFMMRFASPARSRSASDLPIGLPAASRKVLAMPPPTIRLSTFLASSPRIVSLVETFEPPTIATSGRAGSGQRLAERVELRRHQRAGAGHLGEAGDAVRGRLGAVRGAEGVVHVDVAQRGDLARQRLVVLLLALVDPAVLQHHHLAGLHVDAVHPVLDQRNLGSSAARPGARRPARASPRA